MRNKKLAEDHDLGSKRININFRTELLNLKTLIDQDFQRVFSLDLSNQSEKENAINFIKKLEACAQKLKPTLIIQNSDKQNLVVPEVKNHQKENHIGDDCTHLAVKNPNSYMIATTEKRLQIIENGVQVFENSGTRIGIVNDLIYIKEVNSYFISFQNRGLSMKKIEAKSPYKTLLMHFSPTGREGACLKYYPPKKKLFFIKEAWRITVVDLESLQAEFEVDKPVGKHIADFRTLYQDDHQVASLTTDGYVLLYKLDFGTKSGRVSKSLELGLIGERFEKGVSVEVCPSSRYLLVELGTQSFTCRSSRILVVKIEGAGDPVVLAVLDRFKENRGANLALTCYDVFGSRIRWFGLSWASGRIQTYDYDTNTQKLVKVTEVDPQKISVNCFKINRLGDEFFSVGFSGKVMKFNLTN